jgi:hypothetical protein
MTQRSTNKSLHKTNKSTMLKEKENKIMVLQNT